MRPLRIAPLVYAAALAALVSAGPIKHDQRQDGEVNVRADLENFVIVIVPTSQSSASGLLDLLRNAIPSIKASKLKPGFKTAHRVRENGDESTKHFIESKSAAPYHVDLTPTKDGLAKLRPANVEQEQRITSENGEILIAHSPVVSLKHLHGHRPRAVRSVDVAEKKRVVDARGEPTKRENVAKTGGARVQLLNRRSVNIFADVSAENGLHSIEVGGGDDDVDDATANVSENVVAARDESESDEANLIVGSVEEFDSNSIKKNDVDEMDTKDELLLLGAENEQCGPDRRRDSEGVCRFVDANKKK